MSKKSAFRGPFEKPDGKQAQSSLKFEWQHIHHIYRSMVRQLSCKKDSVSDMQTLKLFVNTLSADDKYSFVNRNNLTELIEMQLSEKRKTFSEFYFYIFKI